jgi:AcrR family transcriptional regulator
MAAESTFESGHDVSGRYTRSRRVRAEQRRVILLDAADTVIRRVGPRVSARLIAQEAGVTKPIIYRHFGDIQDLYRALAIRHHEQLARWLHDARERDAGLDRRGRLRSIIEAFFKAIESESNLYRFLTHTGADLPGYGSAPSWFTRQWATDIARQLAQMTGEPEGLPQSRTMGFAIAGALLSTGNWWLEERAVPLCEVIDATTDLLLSGLPPLPSESQ